MTSSTYFFVYCTEKTSRSHDAVRLFSNLIDHRRLGVEECGNVAMVKCVTYVLST